MDRDIPPQFDRRSIFKPAGRVIHTPAPSVPEDTKASPAKLLVEWNGHWYPAEVIRVDGNQRFIRYTGYGDEWNEWVDPERIREDSGAADAAQTEQPRMQPEAGDFVVHWGERWWRAELLEQRGGSNLIRYVGYGTEWDEWVTPERAKTFTDNDAAEATKTAAQRLGAFSDEVAQPVVSPWEVEWGERWWPADILAERDGKYLIQYAGYGENWNEWIAKDRLRVPPVPQ